MGRKRKKQFTDLEENRYGIFMTDTSFDLDVELGRHYLETDVLYKVKVHKINIIDSKKDDEDDPYGQVKPKDKKFFPPVEINAMVNVGNQEQKFFTEGGIARDDTGTIRIGVYMKELEENDLVIDRGDYIEFNMSGERPRYYEVENPEKVIDSTNRTIAGFKPYWREITAIPVKADTIPFLIGDQ
jgi:hypothetical protein